MSTIAHRAEISPETLWQIENGRRRDSKPWSRPRPPIVLAVAAALGIDRGEALELAGYDPAHYVIPEVGDEAPLMAPEVLGENLAKVSPELYRAIQTIVVDHLRVKEYISADVPDAPVRTVREGQHGGVRSRGEVARGVEAPGSARD